MFGQRPHIMTTVSYDFPHSLLENNEQTFFSELKKSFSPAANRTAAVQSIPRDCTICSIVAQSVG
jgi:hypothetical protein